MRQSRTKVWGWDRLFTYTRRVYQKCFSGKSHSREKTSNAVYDKEQPKEIRCVRYYTASTLIFPLCPRCSTPIEREYMNYCSFCGQALAWWELEHGRCRCEIVFPGGKKRSVPWEQVYEDMEDTQEYCLALSETESASKL